MKLRYALSTLSLLTVLLSNAQCAVDLPADTVTTFWGYDPLACATLTPVVQGAAPSTLVWSNGSTGPTITVCDTASTWYTVVITDDTLCTAADSVFVQVVDVHCGNNGNKVALCHLPPGDPANAHTICISANGVPAHLAHGCRLGACYPDSSASAADELALSISPNPMSTNATVSVHSTIAQRVRVSVVDAMGRRFALLLDAELGAGEQRTLSVVPEDLPHGVRFCWVEAVGTNQRAVERVVVVE